MNNYQKKLCKSHFLVFILMIFFPCSLFAQNFLALHPLFGPSAEEPIIGLFFQRMQQELPDAGDGNNRVFVIDLATIPPDFPSGDFPPWICPSPLITGGADYTLTAEVFPNPDSPATFRIRLYLWEMESSHLLGVDEIDVRGLEDLETLPSFLDYVLSWITHRIAQEPEIIYHTETIHLTETIYIREESARSFEEKWLYLGLRGGGGYSRWIYDYRDTSTTIESSVFASGNAALQASVYFFHFLAFQTEVNVASDFRLFSHMDDFTSWSLTVPFLLHFVMQSENLKAGIFGGVSLYVPLAQQSNDETLAYFDYLPDFPGFLFGFTIGRKMGPGYLLLDTRFEYDGHWFNTDLRIINYRDIVRFNIGYEFGFFDKKRNKNN